MFVCGRMLPKVQQETTAGGRCVFFGRVSSSLRFHACCLRVCQFVFVLDSGLWDVAAQSQNTSRPSPYSPSAACMPPTKCYIMPASCETRNHRLLVSVCWCSHGYRILPFEIVARSLNLADARSTDRGFWTVTRGKFVAGVLPVALSLAKNHHFEPPAEKAGRNEKYTFLRWALQRITATASHD